MTAAERTRERILRLVERNPRLTAQQIALSVGVSRQRVSKLLHDLGYTLAWTKGKG